MWTMSGSTPDTGIAGWAESCCSALEDHYTDKGYNNINLVTNRFQAAGFYEKCGFEVEFVRENKHHPKLSKIFSSSISDGGDQCRGVLTDADDG